MRRLQMFERLSDTNIKPTYEEARELMGKSRGLFESIDSFLINELNAENEINFSRHDKCWGSDYQINTNRSALFTLKKILFSQL